MYLMAKMFHDCVLNNIQNNNSKHTENTEKTDQLTRKSQK